jgi:hypothetical protein
MAGVAEFEVFNAVPHTMHWLHRVFRLSTKPINPENPSKLASKLLLPQNNCPGSAMPVVLVFPYATDNQLS